jgi:hypothetical protein
MLCWKNDHHELIIFYLWRGKKDREIYQMKFTYEPTSVVSRDRERQAGATGAWRAGADRPMSNRSRSWGEKQVPGRRAVGLEPSTMRWHRHAEQQITASRRVADHVVTRDAERSRRQGDANGVIEATLRREESDHFSFVPGLAMDVGWMPPWAMGHQPRGPYNLGASGGRTRLGAGPIHIKIHASETSRFMWARRENSEVCAMVGIDPMTWQAQVRSWLTKRRQSCKKNWAVPLLCTCIMQVNIQVVITNNTTIIVYLHLEVFL